jgi:uncharacterized protein
LQYNIKEGISDMSLLTEWREKAYDQNADQKELNKLWQEYFLKEKDIYAELLADPDKEVTGTVSELAEKFNMDIMQMTGFLDGIDESLVTPNNIEEMDENTTVSLKFDKTKLYKNMVGAKAEWLYQLPQWDAIFSKDEQKALYLEEKKSGTVVKGEKIGRNDPCPCGSGKKYKKCCGKNI